MSCAEEVRYEPKLYESLNAMTTCGKSDSRVLFLLASGGGTNNHIGNIRFRQLVNEHKFRYLAASKIDKPRVAMEVVHLWRSLDPPGRYLTKTDPSQGDDSLWHDVGDKKAREKASQCLRERTPDVIPFVKQLQEQDKKRKEEDKAKDEDTPQKPGKNNANGKDTVSSADVVVSGNAPDATTSLAMNTPTSMKASTLAMPDVTHSSNSQAVVKKSLRARDVGQNLPTAAALMENVFDDEEFDDDDEDTLSYATYQRQMQEYLASANADADEYSITDRSILMETMSATSREWLQSFQSINSGHDNASAMMMSIGNSLRDVDDTADMPPPDNLPRSGLASLRSQKMSNAGNSSISMLSDLTDFSSARNKSSRSAKMQTSKAPSNFSMMSELSDLSEGLKDLGLQRGNS
jgi:hypothetical protein